MYIVIVSGSTAKRFHCSFEWHLTPHMTLSIETCIRRTPCIKRTLQQSPEGVRLIQVSVYFNWLNTVFFLSDLTYREEGRKRNLIITVCINLSRNFEILNCLSEQILAKNLGESPKTGNTFYQLSEDIRTSRFSTPPSCALFSGGANISSAKCYFFCAWVSHVMFKRFRKCVLHPTLIVMHR